MFRYASRQLLKPYFTFIKKQEKATPSIQFAPLSIHKLLNSVYKSYFQITIKRRLFHDIRSCSLLSLKSLCTPSKARISLLIWTVLYRHTHTQTHTLQLLLFISTVLSHAVCCHIPLPATCWWDNLLLSLSNKQLAGDYVRHVRGILIWLNVFSATQSISQTSCLTCVCCIGIMKCKEAVLDYLKC